MYIKKKAAQGYELTYAAKYGMHNQITLHNGDCVEKLKLIATASISLIMFDPPYATTALKWDKHLDYAAVIAEFERVLTPLGTVVAFGSDDFSFHLRQAFATHSKTIKYRYSSIWLKKGPTGFLHANNRPQKIFEDIMVFSRGLMGHYGTGPGKTLKRMTYNPQGLVELPAGVKSRNGKMEGGVTQYKGGNREKRRGDTHLHGKKLPDGTVELYGDHREQTHTNYPTTVYEYARETGGKHRHPTKKPVGLYNELIATYSNPGETILDPTMGSGTAGVACQVLGDRNFIGIERDEKYFAICEDRLGIADEIVAAVMARLSSPRKTKEPAWKVRIASRRAARKEARTKEPEVKHIEEPVEEALHIEQPVTVRKEAGGPPANDNTAVQASTIHLGDCLDVMRTMADGSVDLIVTSPPYNLGTASGGGMKQAAKQSGLWRSAKLVDGYASYSDDKPHDEYVAWQREILAECWRLIPEDGAIFYNHKPRIQRGVVQLPQNFAPDYMLLRQIVIWDRACGMNFNQTFFTPSHEYILIFAKPKFKLTKFAADMDVWKIKPGQNNAHPAPFPVELPRRCIQHTNAKVIFDPFTGSGTTGVAALELGRTFLGVELDPGYRQMALDRLAGVTANPLLAVA